MYGGHGEKRWICDDLYGQSGYGGHGEIRWICGDLYGQSGSEKNMTELQILCSNPICNIL